MNFLSECFENGFNPTKLDDKIESYAFSETDKGILIDSTGIQLHWAPKSVCIYNNKTSLWEIPAWIVEEHFTKISELKRWKSDLQTEISWWSETAYQAGSYSDGLSFRTIGQYGENPTENIFKEVEKYTSPKTGWAKKYKVIEEFKPIWTHDESSNNGRFKDLAKEEVLILRNLKLMSQLKYLGYDFDKCYSFQFTIGLQK